MQTNFTPQQLADADIREADGIIRNCVHCGFCLATCPTYLELGDELDSPRGRIYLMKDMLENDKPAGARIVKHIDRCLSCLACMTTCPSGVHYMHLVDHARRRIEETYRRPLPDRLLRTMLAVVLPRPWLFRLALLGAGVARPLARLLPGRLRGMMTLAPASVPAPSRVDRPQVFPAEGGRRKRVALLSGCAQQVLAPQINEATVRLLTRHGCEVVVARGAGCCGALVHHMGKATPADRQAAANIEAWCREMKRYGGEGLDAVVVNASGCGTSVKDYGYLFREHPALREKAAAVSEITRDVSELMVELDLSPPVIRANLTLAYHNPCSMQHGQRIATEPKELLAAAGFTVRDVPEGHLCCGSAGTYNITQPELAARLLRRKVANIERVEPEAIATGNIGCIAQIAGGTDIPILHTVELLDWATGGPKPSALAGLAPREAEAAAA